MKTITITDEQHDFLRNLSKELKTQDNRSTANPVFCVHEKKIVFCPDDCGDTNWFDNEGNMVSDKDIKEIIQEYLEDNKDSSILDEEDILEELEYRKFSYNIENVKVSGQSYFTEKAAQRHIDQNHYHYKEAFVYAESAWRNYEFQKLREILLSLTNNESEVLHEEKSN